MQSLLIRFETDQRLEEELPIDPGDATAIAIGMGQVMGRLAVWVAMVPYCMIHYHKPLPEALAAIVAGLVLGEVAQRTQSIAGGVIVHIGVALTMDMLVLKVL